MGLLFHYPFAHHVLGVALARLRRPRDAERAFQTAISLNPNSVESHARLLRLYTGPCFDIERAEHHRKRVRQLRDVPPPPAEVGRASSRPASRAEPVPPSTPRAVPARALDPARTITVISGLPRSGTSMMMQMLEAAGLDIASDAKRLADADNPRGYYELEAVKRLRVDPTFLGEIRGRAVKVVAPLLPFLPGDHDYRVIFMERDLDEVLASQRKMLSRTGGENRAARDDAVLKRGFASQLRRVKVWLGRNENVRTCFVAHDRALADSAATARLVLDFLASTGAPEERRPSADAMASVVDPTLHRQHKAARGS